MSTQTPDDRRGPVSGRRSYVPFVVLGVIVVVAIAVALFAMGGDDEAQDTTTGGDAASGELLATAAISVDGDVLPPAASDGEDPAAGSAAPKLQGVDPAGQGATVEYDQPTLVAFLAHWCPHCQAELPELVTLAEEGDLDGMDAVVVLTGTDEAAPNYPPAAWLEREGWSGRVILDDETGTAARAFGLSSYPYLVLVDAEGEIIARNAGELGLEGLRDFVGQAG